MTLDNGHKTQSPPAPWQDVTWQDWEDWHWQMRNRISSIEDLEKVIALSEIDKVGIAKSLEMLRMAITPYYASLMDPEDLNCPIRIRSVPVAPEVDVSPEEMEDPLHEDIDSPVPGITHRYPDRALFLITDQCSMYCRHCTRRRYAGDTDKPRTENQIDEAIDYIRATPAIRDVLLSGGDSFTVSTKRLEYIVANLKTISHVEIVRYGTSIPVVMPQRITDELVTMLKKYQPVWINTHFNHPKELTPRAEEGLAKLADAGFVLGNQSVLLKGVNDCPYIMKELVQRLAQNRVRPYYLYQCDLSQGLGHLRTSVNKGIEIIEHLRGHTSGFCVPQFIIDAPGGGGKIPVNPNYVLSRNERTIILRNYEGVICKYTEPDDTSGGGCPEGCEICRERIARGLDTPQVGLEKLLSGEKTVSLEPKDLPRRLRSHG